jgi:hypothetical protein
MRGSRFGLEVDAARHFKGCRSAHAIRLAAKRDLMRSLVGLKSGEAHNVEGL